LLLRGLVPKAAAAELGISEKTLYAHRANLLEKLGARNDRDLARIALERNLL
jgi:two-component system uhpT operon response regulator UhpA